ncbi:MAG: Fic family protein [Gammaproteobacteria bacterium]|nr:Fic family protein [Gammaproteobacteria bacterium]
MPPPPLGECVLKIPGDKWEETGPLAGGRYLHWDELRRRPLPDGLSHKAWWGLLKLARGGMYKELPFRDKQNRRMTFCTPDPALRLLHDIDQRASGNVRMDEPVASGENRKRYLVNSLIEEAITSSQLEGAATTGREARAMLRSGRRPRDHSERMIMNNFRAMEEIRNLRHSKLTPDLVFELHRMVSQDTLEDPSAAGRFRRDDEKIHVVDHRSARKLHQPPPAASLPRRLKLLCNFANGKADGGAFVHPVVRAILLHFMIGYDHPFLDGNGRTARALFYWGMARANYWLMEYVSISSLLKKAPAKYVRAYLHTETDDNDATYFILHQLGIITHAIATLHEYLALKAAEKRDAEKQLQKISVAAGGLNSRQIALLTHALAHPGHEYTVNSHRRSHRIVPQTARTDLQKLAEHGLLSPAKRGRAFVFRAPEDLQMRIEDAAD